jgi:replicative DNA helicase
MRFLVRKEIQSIRDIYETERNEGGLMTGFGNLDSMTNGLRGGEMIVIAGHPCMGKTALASNLVENIATRKENPAACAFFSLEMTSDSLVQRLLCSQAKVLTSVLIGGFVSKGQLARVTEAAAFLGDAPIWIDDTPGLSVAELRVKARNLKRHHDIRLIVIDYLQLLEDADVAGRERGGHKIRSISRSIKALAKELDIPIMVLVQLDPCPFNGGEEPGMRDLRKIGFLERDADLVAFLVRKECYANEEVREELEGYAELVLAKQRNGPTGWIPLTFQDGFLRFESL